MCSGADGCFNPNLLGFGQLIAVRDGVDSASSGAI